MGKTINYRAIFIKRLELRKEELQKQIPEIRKLLTDGENIYYTEDLINKWELELEAINLELERLSKGEDIYY